MIEINADCSFLSMFNYYKKFIKLFNVDKPYRFEKQTTRIKQWFNESEKFNLQESRTRKGRKINNLPVRYRPIIFDGSVNRFRGASAPTLKGKALGSSYLSTSLAYLLSIIRLPCLTSILLPLNEFQASFSTYKVTRRDNKVIWTTVMFRNIKIIEINSISNIIQTEWHF